MTRLLLPALAALALAGTAAAQDGRMPGRGGGPTRNAYANPSAGIAADIALAQLSAGKKGFWHALRQTAADDAVMFVPAFVLARPWLEQRKDIAPPVRLQPYQAWASCDGSLLVTSGLRQDAGGDGRYTHVWRRQPDGGYKWVFGHRLPLAGLSAAPDMIAGKVAECPARRRDPAAGASPAPRRKQPKPPLVLDPSGRTGSSDDGSLAWQVTVNPGGGYRFTASMRIDGTMQAIRDEAAGS